MPLSARKRKVLPNSPVVCARCYGVNTAVYCALDDIPAVSERFPQPWTQADPFEAEYSFTFERHSLLDDTFRVMSGSTVIADWRPRRHALNRLHRAIHVVVAEHSPSHVFIHAGVVEWNGQLVMLPGNSYAGKSTLVWFLVQRGAVYYSDEYALVDTQAMVHPCILPISLRTGDADKHTEVPHRIASKPASPSLVLFTSYKQGETWTPHRLTPVETAFKLIQHCIAMRSRPELVLPVLKLISMTTHSFAGHRGESEQLFNWLRQTT
jgi:hypothetical protein